MTEVETAKKHVQLWFDLRNTVLTCLVLTVLICSLGYSLGGKLIAEKSLTTLIQPLGACWLLLSGWTLQLLATGRARTALVPSLLWSMLTLCSTPPLVDSFNYYLEYTWRESTGDAVFDPATDEPLDVLIVLGGGTVVGPSRAQAGRSGDRVVYAAELFHQGLAHHLITTGDAIPVVGNDDGVVMVSEMTMEIWTKLGIPRHSISSLHGQNTFEELQSIREAWPTLAGKRVGILTSALHLPRALRLARSHGLQELIPVAADFLSGDSPRSFDRYLPRVDTLDRFSRCYHESLAWLVGR